MFVVPMAQLFVAMGFTTLMPRSTNGADTAWKDMGELVSTIRTTAFVVGSDKGSIVQIACFRLISVSHAINGVGLKVAPPSDDT